VVGDARGDVGGAGAGVVRPGAVEGAGLAGCVEGAVRGGAVDAAADRVAREGVGRARIGPAVAVVLGVALVGRGGAGEADGRGDVVDLHLEGRRAGAVVLVGDADGDRVVVRPVGVDMALASERGRHGRAAAGHLVGGREGAVAPVDRDRPGAVRARIREGAEAEGVVVALVGRLVAGGGNG